MDEECNVDTPYADCHRHNHFIFIPNGNPDSDNLNEHVIWGDSGIAKELMPMKTYTRRTIKREEADVDKKENT